MPDQTKETKPDSARTVSGSPPATAAGPAAPQPGSGPIALEQVLWDELGYLDRRSDGTSTPALEQVYRRIGALPPEKWLSALCLSGGGIRSATFNLGVIQALAKLGLLERFDYLSSVSGGGYIAGWLKAWMHREGVEKVTTALAAPAKADGFSPLTPEPQPLDHLRQFSNYLTPRLGLFSADTWAATALIVRNLILNWLVLVPALTALVAIPQIALVVARGAHSEEKWAIRGAYVAIALALWASTAIYRFRRRGGSSEQTILRWAVAPLGLASLSLAVAGLWVPEAGVTNLTLWGFCVLWCILIPMAGWIWALVSGPKPEGGQRWPSDLAGIVLSGAVASAILFAICRSWLPVLKASPQLFVITALPILLGVYLLARTLFVAFASLGESEKDLAEHDNADREWWARLSGWVLILAMSWIGISSVVILGNLPLIWLARKAGKAVASIGGISISGLLGLITALLGASGSTAKDADAKHQEAAPIKELALSLLGPLTVICIVVLLATFSAALSRYIASLLTDWFGLPPGIGPTLLAFSIAPLTMLLSSWTLGWVVNVNRFSLQGLYRNRLVRAFLGASNTHRHPEPFTGFDTRDNVLLHHLAKGPAPRPLTVINATLNLVQSAEHLAWQQRKAESFSMTPFYCGNYCEGYRRSEEYGGRNGMSLGTAITISGAAANPNAGYHSSPLVSFLMTLFNVRLGSWLGNTNEHGQGVYRFSGPSHAWKPLFADLFGFTDRHHPYISLSDGGHFENLGVYEMVLRRCRFILVSDAGEDPAYDFEDLGNLIRKVRIDFGISIDFDQPIRILPRGCEGKPGLLYAVATIHYEQVDTNTPPGRLIYVKPTLMAKEPPVLPYDVFSYARPPRRFPHEPTTDQWFSEAQFESYRALGQHLALQLGGRPHFDDIPTFFDAVENGSSPPGAENGDGL